jgi:L-lactate dehydrogenase complex protein LldG
VSELSGARADVLSAIRRAMPRTPAGIADDYAGVERSYQVVPGRSRADCVALFTDRLEHYNVTVRATERRRLPDTVAEMAHQRGKHSLVVPAGLREALPVAGLTLVPDEGLSYQALDQCEGVLTTATLAIALTGTIVLTHREGEGRRALTLIPDYHLCIVSVDQLFETVPEGFRHLAALQPALVTTISGPSATADIEMIRVRGVHGPRTLDVVIVQGEPLRGWQMANGKR